MEIFDTYKFESENYYDIQYHYRSIDTWLMGIHQSYCEEHKWNDDFINYDLNKYSIFKDEKEEEAVIYLCKYRKKNYKFNSLAT